MPNTPQGVIDFFTTPQIGELQATIDGNGPYTHGSTVTSQWNNGGIIQSVQLTAGVIVQFSGAIPAQLGRTPGFDDGGTVNLDLFEDRLVQLAVLYQVHITGPWIAAQVEEIHYLPYMVRWNEVLPGRIGLFVAPFITVDLYYLTTFL